MGEYSKSEVETIMVVAEAVKYKRSMGRPPFFTIRGLKVAYDKLHREKKITITFTTVDRKLRLLREKGLVTNAYKKHNKLILTVTPKFFEVARSLGLEV